MGQDRRDEDEVTSEASVYDTRPADDDLWFVPAAPDDALAPPGPRAQLAAGADPGPWLAAEARLGRELARSAAAVARLDERLRQSGPGVLRRLALEEAAALSWQVGDRVAVERLALHDADRAEMAGDDAAALAAAGWALRRLLGGPGPLDDLEAFLGRTGASGDAAVMRWRDRLDDVQGALPIVRAAWAFHSWRALAISPGLTEPALVAARIGATDNRASPFIPLAQAQAPYQTGGPPEIRLAAWSRAAESCALRALMRLDAMDAWEAKAAEAAGRLSGRTPRLLIGALMATPALSAGMAARATGVSAAGARRNLVWFERAGLAHEITGHSRFRFWQAAI